MARFRIVRDGGGWKVTKNGRRHYKKTYQTKQEAREAARRAASKGDSIQGQGVDGRWDEEDTKGVFGPRGDR